MRHIFTITLAFLIGILPVVSPKTPLTSAISRPASNASMTTTFGGLSNLGGLDELAQATSVAPDNATAPTPNGTHYIYLPMASNGQDSGGGGGGSRLLKYYLADRVINNSDFAKLANWGINTAIVDFDVNGKSAEWKSVFIEAAKYGISIVIWPSDWNNPRVNCNWEAPFPVSANGDITKIKPLLDVASNYSNFIGVVNGHESFWTCTNMTFDEMAGLKTQLKAYALSKGREIKIWNYINSLYDASMLPDNQISRIMDVAVTWKHCAGNVEGPCDSGRDSALAQINSDRARLTKTGLDKQVDLVYIMQTFTTSGGYNTRFTLPQLEQYSNEFLNTDGLDGYGYYTWDAGWWPDLHSWTDLQPAIPYVYSLQKSR
jgi:hypothetical protein